MGQHNTMGSRPEQLAADFLVPKGRTLRTPNHCYKHAEIDLIVEHRGPLILVAVKFITYG